MIVELTDGERLCLENICRNEYGPRNGGYPESRFDCCTYSDSVNAGRNKLTTSSISGLVSALAKKGLIWTDGENIDATDLGFETFKHYFPK